MPSSNHADTLVVLTTITDIDKGKQLARQIISNRIVILRGSYKYLLRQPAPCFFGKLENFYRWHVLVRSPDPVEPFRGMALHKGWHLDIDPVAVL